MSDVYFIYKIKHDTTDIGEILGELQWAGPETIQEQTFLSAILCKIHHGAMDSDKCSYLTPILRVKHTRVYTGSSKLSVP